MCFYILIHINKKKKKPSYILRTVIYLEIQKINQKYFILISITVFDFWIEFLYGVAFSVIFMLIDFQA